MAIQNVFQRYELKFLINRFNQKQILKAMESYMEPDAYGKSTICNIYYDTSDYILARRSIERPVYKEKFRVRSYGTASRDSTVFMEIKKKYDSVVYKRRISIQEKEAAEFTQKGGPLADRGQIGREIEYFWRLYGSLGPVVHLSYDRTAFLGKEEDLRITFDENIRFRTDRLSLKEEAQGETLLGPDQVLMEIKTGTAIPIWLNMVLSGNHIYKTSFSKYGTAYQRISKENGVTGGFRSIKIC